MFSTGLSAISKTRYLRGDNITFSFWESRRGPSTHYDRVRSDLPKQMREIRFDKIGFDILADTDNVCYALLLKNWQLHEGKGREIM